MRSLIEDENVEIYGLARHSEEEVDYVVYTREFEEGWFVRKASTLAVIIPKGWRGEEPANEEGELYRHYKGKDYRLLGIARDSENGTEVALYRCLYTPTGAVGHPLAIRPREDFFGELDGVPRFAKV